MTALPFLLLAAGLAGAEPKAPPDPREVPKLLAELKSDDSTTRAFAAQQLGAHYPSDEIVAALTKALRDPSDHVRMGAATAFTYFHMDGHTAVAKPVLLKALAGETRDSTAAYFLTKLREIAPTDPEVSAAAARAVEAGGSRLPAEGWTTLGVGAAQGNDDALSRLVLHLVGSDMQRRADADLVLRSVAERSLPGLVRLLRAENPAYSSVPKGVFEAVGRMTGPTGKAAPEALVVLLSHKDSWVRSSGAKVLARVQDPPQKVLDALHYAMANDPDPLVAAYAAEALGTHTPAAMPLLLKSLQDRRWETRLRAIEGLGLVGDPDASKDAYAALKGVLQDRGECKEVRRAAGEQMMKFDKTETKKLLAALKTDKKSKAGGDPKDCP